MKKIMIIAVLMVASVIANAATFQWKASNLYAYDGKNKLSVGSTVSLYAALEGTSTYSLVSTYTVTTAGSVSTTTSGFDIAGSNIRDSYTFYFSYEDAGYTFSSLDIGVTKTGAVPETGTTTLAFGNMATATQTASNWKGGENVPEPTSGLLLLLGMAGLALRRKRA